MVWAKTPSNPSAYLDLRRQVGPREKHDSRVSPSPGRALTADTGILGEIPTGVGFLSLKPGRWVHATRGGKEGDGAARKNRRQRTVKF